MLCDLWASFPWSRRWFVNPERRTAWVFTRAMRIQEIGRSSWLKGNGGRDGSVESISVWKCELMREILTTADEASSAVILTVITGGVRRGGRSTGVVDVDHAELDMPRSCGRPDSSGNFIGGCFNAVRSNDGKLLRRGDCSEGHLV
ncbi:hypothetical protein M5K25_004945 [Dendrobium thyrsiflorum]|uniref:Uncharacterized protein n=1 Tax=Dendrobium thyrsiflorum TaxID=117978 RepID=A0ABD0VG52_DENTH